MKSYQLLTTNKNSINSILQKSEDNIVISIPFMNDTLTIYLEKSDLYNHKFYTVTSSGDTLYTRDNRSITYQGKVSGYIKSMAAFAFAENFIYGIISTEAGNFVIGKFNINNQFSDTLIVYNDNNLRFNNPFLCQVIDTLSDETYRNEKKKNFEQQLNTSSCSSIGIYFEIRHSVHNLLGGTLNNTLNYLEGMFNVVQLIYLNENIHTFISKVFIWTTPDSYSAANNQSLYEFRNLRNLTDLGHRGNLAHLVGNVAGQGGLAFLGQGGDICLWYKTSQFAVSNIYGYYYDLPTYSWDVEVISHEIGHNLSSRHTHWCGWNGGPIDNCNTCFSLPPDGNCSNGPPPPSNGGTIMSYCHGCSQGISFSNGFGVQPGNMIRNYINSNSWCLTLENERFFQNTIMNGVVPQQYDASVRISAGKNVTSGQTGWYVVNYNNPNNFGHVTFRSGQEILLKDGFHAKQGAFFNGKIEPHIDCSALSSFSDQGGNRKNIINSSINDSINVSFNKINTVSFTINPNPAMDNLRISCNFTQENLVRDIRITDPIGKIIDMLEFSNNSINYDCSHLATGIYYVVLKTATGVLSTPFIIIR
jgi:hypothetical protein